MSLSGKLFKRIQPNPQQFFSESTCEVVHEIMFKEGKIVYSDNEGHCEAFSNRAESETERFGRTKRISCEIFGGRSEKLRKAENCF